MKYHPSSEPFEQQANIGNRGLSMKSRLAVVVIVLLVAFGYFGFTAFNEATAYYLTVDEVSAIEELNPNERYQIKGSLVTESFIRTPDSSGKPSTLAQFNLKGDTSKLIASYDGALPELFFNPHSEIVLGGTFGDNGTFIADRVFVKCPSKYQSVEYENPDSYPQSS